MMKLRNVLRKKVGVQILIIDKVDAKIIITELMVVLYLQNNKII
jgi:hypothetical protein